MSALLRRRTGRHRAGRTDDGFTLVELLITIVIIGIIAVPLANVVTSMFINNSTTTARLGESHDEQIAAAYFAQDVASLGVRDGGPDLMPSVWTGAFPAGACGAGSGRPVVLLAWDDVSWDLTRTPPAQSLEVRSAAYVVETAGAQTQLHRIVCTGSGVTNTTQQADIVLAHNVADPLPYVECAGTGCPSAGPVVPTVMTMTLHLRSDDPGNRGGVLQVELTGQRRQT